MIVHVMNTTPPEQFFKWIDKQGVPFKSFVIPDGDSEIRPRAKHVVFLSFDLLKRYLRRVPHKANVYVFCTYEEILPYTKQVNYLDVKPQGITYKPKRLYVPKALVEFAIERDRDFLYRMEQHLEENSFLNHFTTFIYSKLNSKTQQKPVMFVCCNWFMSGEDMVSLQNQLAELESPINKKQWLAMQEILDMPIAKRFKEAMNAVGKNPKKLEDIATKYTLDPYELRYTFMKSHYTEKKIDEDIATR